MRKSSDFCLYKISCKWIVKEENCRGCRYFKKGDNVKKKTNYWNLENWFLSNQSDWLTTIVGARKMICWEDFQKRVDRRLFRHPPSSPSFTHQALYFNRKSYFFLIHKWRIYKVANSFMDLVPDVDEEYFNKMKKLDSRFIPVMKPTININWKDIKYKSKLHNVILILWLKIQIKYESILRLITTYPG